MKTYVHGDVILVAVKSVPKGAEQSEKFSGILQHGERTGHAHRLTGKEADMFEYFAEGRRYLRLLKETPLRHEEHNEIKLPKGDYEIRIVREVDHFADLVRPVVD